MRPPDPLLKAIRESKRCLIATHSPMDGDGLGCGIALQRALLGLGKECQFVSEAPVPRAYSFLEGYGQIHRLAAKEALPPFDLLLGLDAGDGSRLGRPFLEKPEGAIVCNIDHHVSNDRYGDIAWVEAEAAATGELVHALLLALGVTLDGAMSQSLFVSLVTDTGRFCYSSTTAHTLETAAALLRSGAEPDALQRQLYASVPMRVLRLQARASEELRLLAEGRVGLLAVAHDYGHDLGVDEEDVKDLVDLVTCVAGVMVSALVRGLPDGKSKVSLRSKSDRADVAALAAKWGGGGHVRAAGFTSDLPREELVQRLSPDLESLAVGVTR